MGGEVSLLCLSSGLLGVWTVEEELLEHGCSVSLVCKSKVKMFVTQYAANHPMRGVYRRRSIIWDGQIFKVCSTC